MCFSIKHDYVSLVLVLHTLKLNIFHQLVCLSGFSILTKLNKHSQPFLNIYAKMLKSSIFRKSHLSAEFQTTILILLSRISSCHSSHIIPEGRG